MPITKPPPRKPKQPLPAPPTTPPTPKHLQPTSTDRSPRLRIWCHWPGAHCASSADCSFDRLPCLHQVASDTAPTVPLVPASGNLGQLLLAWFWLQVPGEDLLARSLHVAASLDHSWFRHVSSAVPEVQDAHGTEAEVGTCVSLWWLGLCCFLFVVAVITILRSLDL